MSFKEDFDLFIGGITGMLKGIKISDQVLVKNVQNLKNLTAEDEITSMSWGDTTETDILIGTRKQTVKIYDSEFKSFSSSIITKLGTGPIVGITRFQDVVTTCSASGHIKAWRYSKENAIEIDTEGNVEKMDSAAVNSGIIGTGGKNNDLKLWDLAKGEKIFAAKNTKPNSLGLQDAIWVSDLKFIPETDNKVIVSTRLGHVRLYDPKAQRRPTINLSLTDQSLQCISLTYRDHLAIVGSGTGYMLMVDFRMIGNNRVVGSFKGATGSIRQVACHKTKPYVASVGLDSYFRIHNIETKKVLRERFMQVKLNSVLIRSDFILREDENESSPIINEVKDQEPSEDLDNLFDNMDTIGAKRPRRSKQQ